VFGAREAFAMSPTVEPVWTGDWDGHDDDKCKADQYYQKDYLWSFLSSVFDSHYDDRQKDSHKGFCVDKPRTTRPGVKDGNKWDYWGDYWDREKDEHGWP
jgi:hypothetical protein